MDQALDPRITVGRKLTWTAYGPNRQDKAEVVSIEGDSFTVRWDDGRVMSEYSNADLAENGGDFTVEQ